MNEGRFEQMDSPENVYSHPKTAFVAEFLGGSNRLKGNVSAGRFVVDDVALPLDGSPVQDGESVAYVRPHEFAFAGNGEPAIPAMVTSVLAAGSAVRIDCMRQSGEVLEVALPNGVAPPHVGERVHLKLLSSRLYPARV
jgi:sulfate transport system ATP-binding protein